MYYPALEETVCRQVLPNGLTVLVVPRPGFRKKLAYFMTDYGSIHRCFTLDGVACEAPQGVAHYLEHKMFDMPWGEVSADFAALGANPNAFTSYDMTAYYFSCTENFEPCLKLLLQFVSTACFTEESVAKEQGIIGQEIDMNEDYPESVLFDMLAAGLYKNHPVRIPILGTRESIANITPQVLYDCHRAFYNPKNMYLCVVGDVDPNQVAALAEEMLQNVQTPAVTATRTWAEDPTPVASRLSRSMEVAMPMFHLGFKGASLPRGEAGVRQELIGDFAAEVLFGESSPLYLKMYDEGLIDTSFGGGFETIEGMSMLLATGDSEHPEKVAEAILQEARRVAQTGVAKEDFLRLKRSSLGRRIRGLDSFESTCFRLCAYHFSGFDYFDIPQIYGQITPEDIQAYIKNQITPERMCLGVIQAKQEVT